ncbi:hypothetical protein Mco01_51450 [Microbispora corallina]|uniref:Uncharacterized protein n=1 Tax=Microbispora corallina TaxID=83302 RepID=A0ABQ4G537_9ACTN|nr:hypothetical protein [Microbispora corallina]GIH42145.1 hypothetical protein Mco01_51450 [Microbispora corallina]
MAGGTDVHQGPILWEELVVGGDHDGHWEHMSHRHPGDVVCSCGEITGWGCGDFINGGCPPYYCEICKARKLREWAIHDGPQSG